MKKIVITIGRFNPPTIGHEKLIDKVKSLSKKEKADYRIYPTKSQDKKKNPLSFERKIEAMKDMFPKTNINSDIKLTGIFKVLDSLDKKYDEVILVVGSDRVKDMESTVSKYIEHYEFEFSVVSAGHRDPDAQDVSGMSASKMRQAVKDDDKESFMKGLTKAMKQQKKEKLYNDLKKILEKLDLLSFSAFINLVEGKEAKKLTHLVHVEDIAIDGGGNAGLKKSIEFINGLISILKRKQDIGNSKKKWDTGIKMLTVKYDGSPSLVVGRDPENGKFFVGTKSVFAKGNPKKVYDEKTLKLHYPNMEGPALALKCCLDNLKHLKIQGVVQGDMMWGDGKMPEARTINGEKLIVFHPNTLAYGFPIDSEEGKAIAKSNMGIIFHTTYTGGSTLSEMKATAGCDIKNFARHPDVWFDNAEFKTTTALGLSDKESNMAEKLLNDSEKEIKKIASVTDILLQSGTLLTDLRAFNNRELQIKNPSKHLAGFIKFSEEKNKMESKLMKLKMTRREFLNKYKSNLIALFTFMKNVATVKNMIVTVLNKSAGAGVFVKKRNGEYEVATPEGFVAVDKVGGMIKFVNRLQFSYLNKSPDIIRGFEM